ncbi:MAG: quinolinate synthase NadA [Spirochaetes bacterium]|nr:MAG: quinolinate synthase NadA [Spirochaetota bacterium]
MTDEQLAAQIKELAREKNAIILAHNYQRDEVQAIAHHTGDSLELARIAASNNANIIVFCGVHFMAESASMLAPMKKVLLPDPDAGCPMADMAEPADLAAMRAERPDATVVTYINSSAAVKALSDVCCTSANAQLIVDRVEGDKIIFVPDKNLGSWVQRFTKKEIIPWKGFCPTHEKFSAEDLAAVKREHPGALVMVHPECRPEVADMADQVLSTGGMVKFVQTVHGKKIIVGTETGMLYKLKSVAPDNEYILAGKSFICPNMKKITLPKILRALETETPVITVPAYIAEKAVRCLERMLELSR